MIVSSSRTLNFFILILVYTTQFGEFRAALGAPIQNSPHANINNPSSSARTRHLAKRQVSIDDLLSTALQLVKPIFDTGQPLSFDNTMIPKRVSAEQSTGARESKILGAPASSSLRDVPICRGNSQICKFISCTAHNFKYDQNLSNLNLAAQLINDREFRKTISQNPETLTTVCHEQGLSTEQCRLFSRAFQLIDRFMTTIQKPDTVGGALSNNNANGGNADDDDDDIIGGSGKKSPKHHHHFNAPVLMVDPMQNAIFDDAHAQRTPAIISRRGSASFVPNELDDDVGDVETKRGKYVTSPDFRRLKSDRNNLPPSSPPRGDDDGGKLASDEKNFMNYEENSMFEITLMPLVPSRTTPTVLASGRTKASTIAPARRPITPIVATSTYSGAKSPSSTSAHQLSEAQPRRQIGSRTWSTHTNSNNNNNNNIIYKYNNELISGGDAMLLDDTIGRHYGREPPSRSVVASVSPANNNLTKTHTHTTSVDWNQTTGSKNSALARPVHLPRAKSAESTTTTSSSMLVSAHSRQISSINQKAFMSSATSSTTKVASNAPHAVPPRTTTSAELKSKVSQRVRSEQQHLKTASGGSGEQESKTKTSSHPSATMITQRPYDAKQERALGAAAVMADASVMFMDSMEERAAQVETSTDISLIPEAEGDDDEISEYELEKNVSTTRSATVVSPRVALRGQHHERRPKRDTRVDYYDDLQESKNKLAKMAATRRTHAQNTAVENVEQEVVGATAPESDARQNCFQYLG